MQSCHPQSARGSQTFGILWISLSMHRVVEDDGYWTTQDDYLLFVYVCENP